MPPTKHIDSPVLSRRSAESYTCRYKMHRYWSKKSPDVVAAFIDRHTEKGDIVLDPFAGSGVVACEAVRLERRALAIDLNPMATFMARATLTPVPLFRLDWAFQDVTKFCESRVAELYQTRCAACGKRAEIELVKREDDRPTRMSYLCQCSKKRLFKDPTRSDLRLERSLGKHSIPFWYPDGHPLPRIQNEKHQFVHELFTRRNLICLSTILHAIDETEDPKCRDLLRLAFTACLGKCSRLKPISPPDTDQPSLSMGWTAVRFYAPRVCGEVNPWHAFRRAFGKVLKGKEESNRELSDVTLGETPEDLFSGRANVVIATGPSTAVLAGNDVPDDSVDYVLTDPPYADRMQYLALSTLWGSWLRHDFDYDSEVVVARLRGKTENDYWHRMGEVLAESARVLRGGSPAHFFFHDVRGQHFHRFITALAESQFAPQRVIYQPVVKSFSQSAKMVNKTRKRGGHVGDYVVRTELVNAAPVLCDGVPSRGLRRKVADLARRALQIHGGRSRLQSLMHAVYQGLDGAALVEFASLDPDELLRNALQSFASMDANWVTLQGNGDTNADAHNLREELRRALLDAHSMLPPKRDNKYAALQFVFRRFEDERITFDDVEEVNEEIKEADTNRHRRDRYRCILQQAGEALRFQCSTPGRQRDRVVWRKGEQVVCELGGLGGHEIQVRKPSDDGKSGDGQPGVMQYSELEQMLWGWRDTSPRFGALGRLLNPMDLYSEEAGSTLPHGAVDATEMRWKVRRNEPVCSDHYMMELDVGLPSNVKLKPGQFFHILCETPDERKRRRRGTAAEPELTLRRPLSAHRIHYDGFDRSILARPSQLPRKMREIIRWNVKQIDFLYRLVGKGTRRLSQLKPGDPLEVIGPIGQGFSPPETERLAVIVAGGVGIAPLVALAEWLRYRDVELRVYLGAVKEEHLKLAVRPDSILARQFGGVSRDFADVVRREFKEIGVKDAKHVVVCTDDGSVGEEGRVTDVLAKHVKDGRVSGGDVRFYACGPMPMMQGVSEIAASLGARCEVLMEERMGCGVGACYSCVCKVKGDRGETEMKRVCVDGPVLDGAKVRWKT